MKYNKKNGRIYSVIVLAILLLLGFYLRHSLYILEKHHTITSGTVDEVKITGRDRALSVKYHFVENGNVHNSSITLWQSEIKYENLKIITGKSFPVAYNLKNYGLRSYILIIPAEYEYYHLDFPDSLKWLLPMFKK